MPSTSARTHVKRLPGSTQGEQEHEKAYRAFQPHTGMSWKEQVNVEVSSGTHVIVHHIISSGLLSCRIVSFVESHIHIYQNIYY